MYVDKTELICQMAEQGGYYFLSRPRRFGKSLLTSTLKELYSGDKALFKGLWAENNWDWGKTNPVVHISFSSVEYGAMSLDKGIEYVINQQAEEHQISLVGSSMKQRFGELLKKLATQSGRVVLLIDEYDKPIIDYLDDLHRAKENRAILKSFYSVLKDSDAYLELVFITGVSKFSKMSIFSDLNNLVDITLEPSFGSICGYTQVELERDFEGYIAKLMESRGIDRGASLALLRQWYNGYNFLGKDLVYNPWSILSCLRTGLFNNYWFISGTPTFLINILKDKFFSNLDDVEMSVLALESYDLENMEIVPLLFQTGYLTIKSQEDYSYTLSYPNREVRDAMLQHLIGAYRHETMGDSVPLMMHLRKAIKANDLPKAISIINTAFSTIPYHIFDANGERYYHTVIHLLFTYLGLDIRCEVASSNGRLDAIVHTDTHIYIFEFKLNQSADVALAQIKDNGYDKPYLLSGKELVLVGVNFDGGKKEVGEWKVG